MSQDKDDLKIIDFGLARELGEEESIELDRLQVRSQIKRNGLSKNGFILWKYYLTFWLLDKYV